MVLQRLWLIFFGVTTCLAASNSSTPSLPYNYTYNPEVYPIYQLSDDSDFAFFLEQLLAETPTEAASSGEVLRMATQIDPNNYESIYNTFQPFAEKVFALAESINSTMDPAGARESYFRASTYWRAAVFYFVGNASDPRLYASWPTMLDAFDKAVALMQPPGIPMTLNATNSSIGPYQIPAYFFPASKATDRKRPTVIVTTGYDGAQQDVFHLECGEVLKRGVNCMTYEGPGQPTVRRTQSLPFIRDWWTAVTPVVDYLLTRDDVDPDKIVLLGDSFGGQLVPLAASEEPRLNSLVLLDGLPSLQQALIAVFPPSLVALYNQSNEVEFNKEVDSIVSDPYLDMGFRVILDYTLWAFNTSNAYDAWGAFGNMAWNQTIAAKITQPVFVLKGQDDTITLNEPQIARYYLETGRPNGKNLTYFYEFLTSWGAGEHTSIGAESLLWVKIFGWLSEVWGGYSFAHHE